MLDQSFTDWELVLVDDGSTDGTADLIDGIDPRVRLIRSQNRGASAARNLGLATSRGRYVTFLDSDDQWLPHFLALTVSFLEHHPQEAFVATEFLARNSAGESIVQDRSAIRHDYLPLARLVGSEALELPNLVEDDYLRVYSESEPVGDWWRGHVAEFPALDAPPRWYRGNIASHYRWGHFHALWCLLLRREVISTIGSFDEARRSCADLRFLVELCRRFRANLLAVPSVIKWELSPEEAAHSSPHLASGAGYLKYLINSAELYRELFIEGPDRDPETERLYGLRCFATARKALITRDYSAARRFFSEAGAHLRGNLRLALLGFVARFAPVGPWGSIIARMVEKVEAVHGRLRID